MFFFHFLFRMVKLVRDHFHSKCECFRENVPKKRQQIVTSFRAVVQAVSPIFLIRTQI